MGSLQIGILTYHFSDNFGALMQAYGLKTWLEEQGHTARFINYHPPHVEQGGNFTRPLDPRQAKTNAKIAYLKLSALQRRLFGSAAQHRAFKAFQQDELGMDGPPMPDKASVDAFLKTREAPYDLIIVGSDQIWAASQQRGLDPVYFGDLAVPSETRRISYAPSFGRASVDAHIKPRLTELLNNLDGISVRERSGADIVRDLLERDVACVPDPTLLLGDFKRAIETAEPTPVGHVFCYALRSGKGIRDVAKIAGQKLGAKVLSPYNVHRRWPEIGQTIYPSPKGWIAMVDKAGFVVTNSFHGTVFSILLQKPFIVVGLPGTRASLNERALNLLGEVGLKERFVENGDLAAAEACLSSPIDWSAVTPKLTSLQQAGRNYLAQEISKAIAAREATTEYRSQTL